MTTALYDRFAEDGTKRVQWLVEIDLFRCDNTYTQAPCTAADAGDGSRCYYSFPTCQDPTNFIAATRTFRFCLSDVPWADPDVQVFPLLKRIVPVPQAIDPTRLNVFPEKIQLQMGLAYNPPPPDHDKGSGFFNSTRFGEFWRNLIARNPNYSGRAVRIYRGFSFSDVLTGSGIDGFPLADFEKVGPTYQLKAFDIRKSTVTIVCESPLAELDKRQVPIVLSEDNVLEGAVLGSTTTWDVTNASEVPEPTDFTRNKVYLEVESEIVEVTARDTGLNQLTVVRGAFGTTAVGHADQTRITHVVAFGKDNGDPDNAVEVIQDLMEWAGVAVADVDTAAFDSVKEESWPEFNIIRIVRKTKKVSKLIQQLRETRGIAVFIDSAGKWSCTTTLPNRDGVTLSDDECMFNTVEFSEDDEQRTTRVLFYYDPTEDNAFEPEDFAKVVVVIDAELESDNFFDGKREKVIIDNWLDPNAAISEIANLGQRLITRLRFGTRVFSFKLETKDATDLNVGENRNIQTFRRLGIDGQAEVRPVLIVAKSEADRGSTSFEAMDTNFGGRFLRMGENTMTDSYDAGTTAERAYGYWGDGDNRVGTINEAGYIYY
jgi:hypothetical protein